MAGNRDIHGSVVLDVEVEGEERARTRLAEAFSKLNTTVNVNADFNKAQVQAALTKVANRGGGLKVDVNAKFSLPQMRTAARAAAEKGNGITVGVNGRFSKAQLQRELIASSAGLRIPVLVKAVHDPSGGGSTGKGGISDKLAREYRLATQAASFDAGAAQAAVRGVNQRIGAFQAASLRMKEITAKSEADRVKLHEAASVAIAADDRKLLADQQRRLDKLADDRQRDAQQLLKDHEATENKLRVERTKTAELENRLQAEVAAGRDKFDDGVRAQAEKEQQKRITRQLANESDAARHLVVLDERGNQSRLTNRDRVLGRIEIREDAHIKRQIELQTAAALRRDVIEAQLRARIEAADRAFAQRRQLAEERAQRTLESRANKPILQRVLLNTDKINSSLTEFDRTVTRTLFVTLKAFTVWSAGVTAAVTGAAIAGAVAFGRLEDAGIRAGTVVASQVRAEEFINAGKAVSSYADVTEYAQKRITENAQKVALATTGFTPTELIEGTRALLQSGQSLDEALVNIDKSARFAQVSQIDLTVASEGLAAGLAATGKDAEYSAKLIDQIQFTADSALGNSADYLEAFANRGASSFRTYGEGIEETLTLLKLLGQTGVTGRTAGTQASIIIRDIAKSAAKEADNWKAYGIAVKSASTPTVTFQETLVSLAGAIEKAQKGNRIAQLRKELGFMDKSFGSILQIIPQVNELGATGLDNFASGLVTSTGTVNRAVEEINKGLPAQFDKVGDALDIALGKLGARYGAELTDIFNELSGEGGLIPDATAVLVEFGDEVADVLERVLGYLRTDEFLAGMATLREAVEVTMSGVAEASGAFTSAFADGEEATTTFEAIADAILAFSRVSATALPAVARILGEIFNFLIENADAFETFAKMALGVYALRKAYALLFKPVATATLALTAARDAILAASAAGNSGLVVSGLSALATRFGFVSSAATTATASIEALTAAQLAQARAANATALAGTLVPGVKGAAAKSAAASAGTLLFAGTRLEKFATTFPRIANALGRVTLSFTAIGGAALRFAGIVGIVVSAGLALFQTVRGIVTGFNEAKAASPELQASIARISGAFSALGDAATFVMDIVNDFFFQVGKDLGRAAADAIGALGEFVGLVDSVVHADWDEAKERSIGFFKATGSAARDGAIALGPLLMGLPVVGASLKSTSDSLRAMRDAQEQAKGSTQSLSTTIGALRENLLQARHNAHLASLSQAELARYTQVSANVARLSAMAQAASQDLIQAATQRSVVFIDRAKDAHVSLAGTVGGFSPTFMGMAQAGESAATRVTTAAYSATSQMLAMQAALQASFGQTSSSQQSMTNSLLEQQLANAKQGVGALTVAQAAAQIKAQREYERRQALIGSARAGRRDAKIIEDALGTGAPAIPGVPATAATPEAAARAAERARPVERPRVEAKLREFVDPDEAIQSALDRLKPAQRAAEVQKLIDAATERAGASLKKSSEGSKQAADGMLLTRRQTLLLAEAMPQLDKAIDEQRGKVTELEEALTSLQQVQLTGSKAYSDAAFENEQATKRLQLQRLDLIAAGNTEGSIPVREIDKQIKALQDAAERAKLVESLDLDPKRRQLEQTMNPVKEDTVESILAQFAKLTAARQTETDKLTQQEAVQARLNEQLQTAQSSYEKIDAATQRSIESFNKQATASAEAKNKLIDQANAAARVASQATSGAKAITNYSKAVENVPSGKGVVDKSLKDINDKVTELTPQFQGAGDKVMVAFTQGVNRTNVNVLRPAWVRIIGEIQPYLESGVPYATRSGEAVMGGFLAGLKQGFGTKAQEGSVANYLGVFIPDWIIKNKGPVAYDATILVPAGHAVMEGFGRGLREGFGQVAGFVKDVGPSLSEFISDEAFSDRTATIMADIAMGKTPDVDGMFDDIRAAMVVTPGVDPGAVDPGLSFLHKTLSLADTTQMAFGIVKALGGGLNTGGPGQLGRPDGSTSNNSRHEDGVAADIGTGGANPTAASLELFAKAKKMLGSIFRQVIHNGVGLTAGGGSFADTKHFDHVHLEFLQGKGFAESSGKIGKPPVIDIPGASTVIDQALNAAAKKTGVELALLAAIAKQESGFRAVIGSPVGAQGLMQLMPGTARSLGVTNINDPFQNALGGAKYIKQQIKRFTTYPLAMAAYNAGPGNVEKYGGIPPFAETRNYVRLVSSYLDDFRKMFGGFREAGGPVAPGKAYVVGEKRPEIFVPKTAGVILPDANATLSGGGAGAGNGMTYQDNRTIHNEVHTAATNPEAIVDYLDARTRSRMTGVNFR